MEKIRGIDQLKLDSTLGSLSIIRVHRLVCQEQSFLNNGFHGFLKNFSLTSKICLVYNFSILARELKIQNCCKNNCGLRDLSWQPMALA